MANPAYTYTTQTISRHEICQEGNEYVATSSLKSNPLCQYIVFLVEQTFFTLPRYCFEEGSQLFRDLFTLPRVQGQPPEGSCKEHPLRLDGIAKADFIPFVTVLCQDTHKALTWLAWLSVFKLASMWDFETVRKKALREMTQMRISPVDRIITARTYDIPEWYWIALMQLSEMQESLGEEDAKRLGYNFSTRVGHLQGFRRGIQSSNYKYKQGSSMYRKLTEDDIMNYFKEELKDVPLAKCSYEVQARCEKIRAPVIKNVGLGGATGSIASHMNTTKPKKKYVIM